MRRIQSLRAGRKMFDTSQQHPDGILISDHGSYSKSRRIFELFSPLGLHCKLSCIRAFSSTSDVSYIFMRVR
jgi:hypothetical protein